MTLNWSENVTFKFLQEYKKHDCLWNENSNQYWNCCLKRKAVRTILQNLNIPTLTESNCQQQIEAITKKYDQEQSKILHGLYAGKIYKSKLLWYPLMQDMLTKTIGDKKKDQFNVTICTNSALIKKKKTQTNKKKKKIRSNISSPTQITYNSCGHKIVRKVTLPGEIQRQRRKPKKKMSDKYTSCVQCPSFEINPLKSNEERETTKSKDQNTLSQQSFCVREIKKRREISTKSAECASCCKNSENVHYAAKDNYNPSRSTNAYSNYFNKTNNLDLNYNDNYKSFSDRQTRYRTRYVYCPNSLRPAEKIVPTSDERNFDNFSTIDRIVCTNKNLDACPYREEQDTPEQDNLNKSFCVRSKDNSIELSSNLNANDKKCCADEQRVIKYFPRVDTKFENGAFDAYSQFKISIQCFERAQNKQKVNDAANRETQTALEIRQQAIGTDATIYSSKETQCEGTATQSKQTGIDDVDLNAESVPNTVCVSCDQTDENDYFLLMPGGKCVKLAQRIFANENFVPCPGANDSNYDDESFSICTETSITTQDSKMVDSNTMTTPELLDCVANILRSDSHVEIQEISNSQGSSKTKNRIDKESQCRACKSNQVDEDFKFCFEKLFNKKLSNSDCFPCLKEKLDKTGDLTKKILYILKYSLEQSSNAENNPNGSRFKSKNTKEIIKKLCKCVKKLSDAEVLKQSKSKNLTFSQNKENQVTRQVATEEEPSISSSTNLGQKNVGIEKQTETDKRLITSRSMNTLDQEIPVEIIQTVLESEGTNTDCSTLKETGTNTIEKKRCKDASIQACVAEKCNDKIKMTANKCREPILVRVISSSDRQRGKMQSQSSDYSTSESDFRKFGLKRVCFNDKTQFHVLEKDLKNCEENCGNQNNWTKIKTFDRKNLKVKRKFLDKKCIENPRVRNMENRKIFYSDFFD